MIAYIEYLGLVPSLGIAIIGLFTIMQIIGEVLEFTGKVVPGIMKVRKIFAERKQEKQEQIQTFKEVKQLLSDVNAHYSDDNISKRDEWMKWVNDRAIVYDKSIEEIKKSQDTNTNVLKEVTKVLEEVFVQSSRDRIIDFSVRVSDYNAPVSREEFNRIFKVYDKYEKFLEDHGLTNGEIDIVYNIIIKAYEHRMENHSFTEDIHGYI